MTARPKEEDYYTKAPETDKCNDVWFNSSSYIKALEQYAENKEQEIKELMEENLGLKKKVEIYRNESRRKK